MGRQLRLVRHLLRRGLLVGLTGVLIFVCASPAQADSNREFIMSCSYGVLAGTLVGAATLAFTDKPGDNLNKVARGASLGLYAGMLLGAYVAYGLSDDSPEEDPGAIGVGFREPPPVFVSPLITERGLEGASIHYSVLQF